MAELVYRNTDGRTYTYADQNDFHKMLDKSYDSVSGSADFSWFHFSGGDNRIAMIPGEGDGVNLESAGRKYHLARYTSTSGLEIAETSEASTGSFLSFGDSLTVAGEHVLITTTASEGEGLCIYTMRSASWNRFQGPGNSPGTMPYISTNYREVNYDFSSTGSSVFTTTYRGYTGIDMSLAKGYHYYTYGTWTCTRTICYAASFGVITATLGAITWNRTYYTSDIGSNYYATTSQSYDIVQRFETSVGRVNTEGWHVATISSSSSVYPGSINNDQGYITQRYYEYETRNTPKPIYYIRMPSEWESLLSTKISGSGRSDRSQSYSFTQCSCASSSYESHTTCCIEMWFTSNPEIVTRTAIAPYATGEWCMTDRRSGSICTNQGYQTTFGTTSYSSSCFSNLYDLISVSTEDYFFYEEPVKSIDSYSVIQTSYSPTQTSSGWKSYLLKKTTVWGE